MEGAMANPVSEMERILREEIRMYAGLLDLEEGKSGAIVRKDGKALESVTARQEALLVRLAGLEESRKKCIAVCAGAHGSKGLSRNASLSEIARLAEKDVARRLLEAGGELRRLTVKLDSLFKTNNRLIRDNLEFFDRLLSGLKESVSVHAGYCEKGIERRKVAGSLVLNTTV
jgi:flagellar biosynthesis/type III secretory pathway chaperone